MTDISPTAQVVLGAVYRELDYANEQRRVRWVAAAALRAAADEVAPLSYEDVWTDGRMLQYEKDDPIRNKLLAIATELENYQ